MPRLAVFLLAVLAFGMAGMSVSTAAVRPYAKLSVQEQIALQVSEQRVVLYDEELATLDRQRAHRKISADEYQWKSDTVVFSIQQEAQFQNAILVHGSELPQSTKDVLETMGHGLMMIPVGVGYVVAACPQVVQFLALIH
jgi:hypothetical protein